MSSTQTCRQAGKYFVDGAVRKPGSYRWAGSYTATQALAVAGGVDNRLADKLGQHLSPSRTDERGNDRPSISIGVLASEKRGSAGPA